MEMVKKSMKMSRWELNVKAMLHMTLTSTGLQVCMQNARLYAAATWALEHTRLKHYSGASLAVLSPFQFNWPSRLSVTQIQITVIWLASVCPIGRRRVWVCKQRIQSGSIIQMPYHGTLTHKSSQKHHL